MPLFLADEQQMLRAGQRLAPLLSPWLKALHEPGQQASQDQAHNPGQGGVMVFLHGQLGAGKTTLVRGMLRALGVRGAVRSPTYTLIEPYEVHTEGALKRVFHLDLYRLADPDELDYLGWQEMLGEGGLLLIEWPERGAAVLPPPDLSINIAIQPPGRLLTLTGCGEWSQVATAATRVLTAGND